jgi:hypothetical protein
MNIDDRKVELQKEITALGDFYAREYNLAVEPLQRELMDLEMLSPPKSVKPVFVWPLSFPRFR